MQDAFSTPNIIGYVGVLVILYTYYQTHAGKMDFKSYSYSWQNILGAILILFSLYYHPNPPSVVIEIAWMGISFYGLVKVWSKNHKKGKAG